MNKSVLLAAAVVGAGLAVHADAQWIMMPDSVNNRLVLFDTFDGSVVNGNFFGLQAGTPIHAINVGNEIWVSEQIGDRISRWDLSGNLLGNIGGQFPGGGLDNIRGMSLIGNTVYVSNAGTNNDAPGAAVVMFDTNGNNMGSFSTAGLAPSPFHVLAYQGGLLVSSSAANDDIHHFDINGNSIGTFHNTTTLNFAQQMTYASNGDILVSGFSSNNVVRLDASTGDVISTFAASNARGVYELGNGNIMWTNSAGAHIYDVNTGASTLIYSGGGRYLEFLVPSPGVLPMLGLAGLIGARRRR